jgi:hypothetical protein
MPIRGNRLAQELQKLKKRKGTEYKDIWENLKNRAAEISKAPPYNNPLSLARFFRGTRKPPRPKLLRILAWGFEITDPTEINRVLKLAQFEALSEKEREDFQPRPTVQTKQRALRQTSQVDEVRGKNTSVAVLDEKRSLYDRDLSSVRSYFDFLKKNAAQTVSGSDSDAWASERTYLRYRNEPCPRLESPVLVQHLKKRYDNCRPLLFGKTLLPLHVIWKNVTKCIRPDQILGHLDDAKPIHDTTALTYVPAEYGRARKFIKRQYESGRINYEGCEYCMTQIRFESGQPKIDGAFGYYYDSIITQYAIEWELRKALLAGTPIGALSAPGTLPLREAIEAQGNPALSGHGRRAALSISTLLVFQRSDGSFSCLIRRRSQEVGVSPGMLHVVPAGMFEAANTGDPWSIELSIWRELLEEVYNDKDLLGGERAEILDHVRGRQPVRLLRHLIDNGEAEFSVTGIVCNLLNLAPEICTVLFVPDPRFVEERKLQINWEYISEDRAGSFHVPWKKIDEVIETETPKYGIVPGAAACISLGREWIKQRHHM